MSVSSSWRVSPTVLMVITSGVTESMLVSLVSCASQIASLRRTEFCVLGSGQTGLIELVILSSLVLSLVSEPITLEANESRWRTSGSISKLGVEMSVCSLIWWLSDLSGISDGITLWSQWSPSEFSSICSFDFGWERSTLSQIELWWPKLVTLCSTGIHFWTVQTFGWGIMEISKIILFWTEGTLCLSMLFCAGDWLKCLLPFLYISLRHWAPPVWVFISPTEWTQIRALTICKMTMFPAMKTNIFHLITWERTPVWSLLGRIFHGHFDWIWFIHIWSSRFQRFMGFMPNIKCVISKFTIVGIMWYIFRFSCDIAATNLRYGFLNLMAADVWWYQWLCTITRFTVVITFVTGICSTDRWHRSLKFIVRLMGFRLSCKKASTIFFKSVTQVGILTMQFICIVDSITEEFVPKW